MQNLFLDTRKLDESCRVAYGLTEEIMMENAAMALEKAISENVKFEYAKNRVLILCGGGNNGADGYALARRLRIHYDVIVFQCAEPKSPLCILQAERAEKCGTRFFKLEDFTLEFLESVCVVVDCIYGSGFRDELNEKLQILLNDVNEISAFKIACDVPSGIGIDGHISLGTFRADLTVTMGALKLCLYQDLMKDYIGKVICADLGVGRRLYENSSNFPLQVATLLDESDVILPNRRVLCVNKGHFGHAVVAVGEKHGAAILAGNAALCFGTGLVSIIDLENEATNFDFVPPELMSTSVFPEKMNAFALGSGLGRGEKAEKLIQKYFDFLVNNPELPCVLDADVFYSSKIKEFLEKRSRKVILTPHPKEFQSLLKICDFGEYTLNDCVMNRPKLMEAFCKKYPKCVLLVKGANTMIGYFDSRKYNLYVNPIGRPCLAKAGSGDVLTGLIVALLAQKYKCIDAAASASLAHSLASQKIKCDYAMTPTELIEKIAEI